MSDTQKSPEELRSEIEETREQLGETVEELAAKADVKARLHEELEQGREAIKRRPYIPIGVGVGVAVLALVALRRRS
jgi:ElaB/YqjD/DUF883 family membrane-anchored ribosome-binding protein